MAGMQEEFARRWDRPVGGERRVDYTRPGFEVPEDSLRTPDEWCSLRGLFVLDPDGWRGRDGRPWTDPITEAEFQDRLRVCTIRYDAAARAYLEAQR